VRPGDQHTAGGQDIDATAPVIGTAGRTQRVVDGRRFVGVDHTRPHPLGHTGGADDAAAVVVEAYEVVFPDPPGLSVSGVETRQPVVVAVDQDPVFGDIVECSVLAVVMRVERVAGVRRYELQRILCVQRRRVRPLPRFAIGHDGRTLGVFRVEALETGRLEFQSARLGLQAPVPLLGVVRGEGGQLGSILKAPFREPPV